MKIFIIVWAIWLLSEVLLNRILHSKESLKEDKGSLKIIWLTIIISIILGVIFAIFTEFMISSSGIFQYSGLFLIIFGMILRFFAVFSLGKFFTVNVTLMPDHKIKKDGLYKIIRHPSYAGSLISFFGFGLSLNNYISLFLIFIPVFFSFLYRIKIEENLLERHFGKEYQDYKSKTYKLIPYVY